jgi:secreted PhoX family phosphatase
MSIELTRRAYLKLAGAAAIGFVGLRMTAYQERRMAQVRGGVAEGYGPLVSDPERRLDLPAGFSYQIISERGQPMDDGLLVPGGPDGMAALPLAGGLVALIRNHELSPGDGAFGTDAGLLAGYDQSRLYDLGSPGRPCAGGTTTVVYDPAKKQVLRQHLSLAGTTRNCAGGPTPWGSWITCEETVDRKGENGSGKRSYTCQRDHGYNFEVPANAAGAVDPVPLTAMGRFNHEAVAVDPATGIVYQTEDRGDGLIYRFLPTTPGKLADGGRLQVLAIAGRPQVDTRNWNAADIPVGTSLPVTWQDIDQVEAPKDDLRRRGFEQGAAVFARGEGMWYATDGIYFACTNGGQAKLGQIWRYTPGAQEGQAGEAGGMLTLFIEPNDSQLVHNADNLTVSPWGDLVVCEDRGGEVVRMVGVTPQGACYTFSHSHLKSEFAGACFSPDGSTLFVNSQGPGLTFAITGPWQS